MKMKLADKLFFGAAAVALAAIAYPMRTVAISGVPNKEQYATFYFDSYLRDNGCSANIEGYITVNVTSVIPLPAATPIEVYKRLKSASVSDPWTYIGQTAYSNLPNIFICSDPNTYNFYIAADYVPPQPVVTNEVWQINGFPMPTKPGTYVFPHTTIEVKEINP